MEFPISNKPKIQRILKGSEQAKYAETLTDLYALIGQLAQDVYDIYPHIACRTQCNTCCKGTSMPSVSPIEWSLVYQHILSFWDEEQKTACIEGVLSLYQRYRDILWQIHDTIQTASDMEKIKRFSEILPALSETTCPLLVNEQCSVYASRPAKCRAHGAFVFIFDSYTQMHACQSEVDKMETKMIEWGSRQVVMPVWNHFETTIMQKFNPIHAKPTILAIWLYTHIHDQQFVPEINRTPDFDYFRSL